MTAHRIQLDFLMTPTGEANQGGSWGSSSSPTASSSTSSGPTRVVQLSESSSPDSLEAGHGVKRTREESGSLSPTEKGADIDADADADADEKQSDDGEHGGGSAGGGGSTAVHHHRKYRGKQAFRHRKSHIKSKNGCFSCKERRVKCDEAKPECKNCLKRSLRCDYPPPPSAPEIVFAQPFVVGEDKGKRAPLVSLAVRKLEKSLKPIGDRFVAKALEFRMSKYNQIPVQVGMPDLRLMQNFTMNVSPTLIGGPNTTLWRKDTAELAFKHNFLMHALLMISARHLIMLEPNDKEHKLYELQHRQHALGTIRLILSDVGVTAANYDALIAANTLLAFHSCAAYDHNTDAASDEYLPLMNGVKNIVKEMWGKKSESIFDGLLSMPLAMDSRNVELQGLEIMEMLDDNEGPANEKLDLSVLLPPNCSAEHKEMAMQAIYAQLESSYGLVILDSIPNFDWAAHGNIIYQKVLLSLLPLLEAVRTAPGSIQMDMTSNISCALVAWPAVQPNQYIELVKNREPKAMIILAHYYAAMCHLDLEGCWWLQGRPKAMCRSICRLLGEDYARFMRWPREACGFDEEENTMDMERVSVPLMVELEADFD